MIDLSPSRKLAARPRAGCFPVLFLLAGWLALVTPLRADNPPTYLFQIDGSAVAGGFQPIQIVLDSSNNLYVTEAYGNRVVKLAANGSYLTQWGGYGTNNGQFNGPGAIAVDRSNNVYVADQNDSRVEKFTGSGNYLAQWGSHGTNNGQFQVPDGIAVDSSNNVYVTDQLGWRVEKFDSNGAYLAQWAPDFVNGLVIFPFGIAVDRSNNVYVADHNGRRVVKFDSNGNYLMQWGSEGTGNGQFISPAGIAVDSSNNVYVIDDGELAYPPILRVEKFTSNGNYLTQWGTFGSGSVLSGIAVDSTGNFIYVAEPGYGLIQVFVNNAYIVPPMITSPPASQTVPAGINVTFSNSVVGTRPLAYQWTSNNVALAGATNPTFTLSNVSPSDSATYAVLVTNRFGSVLSSNAVLAVLPALVTTQPAWDISPTGAVLNGWVTVGPKETVTWFEWGTDTNYGNIAGASIVPGNNGGNNITAALNGLSGNIYYHYRIVAANDFGIVYGDDQVFTVGFAPTATTLAPINSTNGSTLNALVNPEGWNTTVYFQWVTPTLTNSTPGMDIGAGAASLNVSSFVPGLAPFTPYQYRVMASNALGTVFGEVASWNPPFVSVSGEAGVVFTSFHSFTGDDGGGPNGLVQGSDGNFYGTTYGGGGGGGGTVFKISANGVLTSLYAFINGSEFGYSPSAGLVQGTDGNLYGTTEYGGFSYSSFRYLGNGTVFTISSNGTLRGLSSFRGEGDGWGPKAGLVQGSDGNFYGTTSRGPGFVWDGNQGPIPGDGNVFKLSPNGWLTSLYSFYGPYADEVSQGTEEPSGLVQGRDGYLYGTTEYSGAYTNLYGVGQGTVFKISTNGALTTLYSFTGANDGANAHAGLVQGSDGSFYGTTEAGGTTNYNAQTGIYGYGTVFKISTNGALTSLYSFTGANDGANPRAGLVQGSNGYLYGTTVNGGSSGIGTVFAVNTNGTGFTTLYRFSAGSTNASDVYTNSDGANPQAALILSGNTLYGTTSAGGSWGYGTVFSLRLPGPPRLTIIPYEPYVILTWPTDYAWFSYAGYTLQSTTNLGSSAVWTTVSSEPVAIRGENVVINTISGGHQFYRLSQQLAPL